LLVVLIGASLFLFYGPGLGGSLAGFAAFLAIPAAIGGLVTFAGDPYSRWPLTGCFVWPTLAIVGLVFAAWLIIGEGAVCIAMILPLWIPAAIGGALSNRLIRWHQRRVRKADPIRFQAAVWLVVPLTVAIAEARNPPEWREVQVVRSITVSASAERIWPLLVQIPAISPSEGKVNFTQDVLGIARPHDAQLVLRGNSLVRLARWNKGITFEEQIDRLDSGRAISWRFSFPNSSLQRFTDQHISPDGTILQIARGSYRLTDVGQGQTRVTLETRYRMRSRMSAYLELWGERVLGDIQDNVLTIIQQRAELPTTAMP
jgi:hypothetical protein